MNHWYDPLNLIMMILTIIIAIGFVRSLKNGRKFATVYGLVSLILFLFADYLIISGT